MKNTAATFKFSKIKLEIKNVLVRYMDSEPTTILKCIETTLYFLHSIIVIIIFMFSLQWVWFIGCVLWWNHVGGNKNIFGPNHWRIKQNILNCSCCRNCKQRRKHTQTMNYIESETYSKKYSTKLNVILIIISFMYVNF